MCRDRSYWLPGVIKADEPSFVEFLIITVNSFMLILPIAGLPSSYSCGTRIQLGFLRPNVSLISCSFSPAVKLSESNHSEQNGVGIESFTVNYLVDSCGMSSRVAKNLSKWVKLKDPDRPDSVLQLLRSYGLSGDDISRVVKSNARVLLADSDKIILPKLRFLQSIGFSASEIPELLSSNPTLLTCSLEKRLIPHYETLKSVLGDPVKARRCLKSSKFWLSYGLANIFPNIEVLRNEGVPEASICSLLFKNADIAFMDQSKFLEHVKFVKETGVDPSKYTFVQAIFASSQFSKSSWEGKLDFFERCGWSRDVTLLAFSKYPMIMCFSEKKITNTIKFLTHEMGLRSEDLAACPTIFGYSLKRRIVPRWSVFQILKMKGLIRANLSLSSMFITSEEKFLENFVIKYQEKVPQILKLYKGELEYLPEAQT